MNTDAVAEQNKSSWNYQPSLPIEGVPVFVWPPRPVAAIKYLLSRAYLFSVVLPFSLFALITWAYLQPAIVRCVTFEFSWIAQMYFRNLMLFVLIVGGLHLYFFTFKRQRKQLRFSSQELSCDDRKFFARDQVWDNIFWSCISGVTLWTGYEVFFMWSYANDLLPFYLDWREDPIWFVLIIFAIPFFDSAHFYFIHRLLHWKPLYRVAHAVHHRNVSTGPWSGFSMHPLEHLIYLSNVLIHVLFASHPIHIFFHLQWNAIGAGVSHTGYESLTVRGKPMIYLSPFHHQLHHRLYNCNYGNGLVPMDKLFGSDHDGTDEAWRVIRNSRRAKEQWSETVVKSTEVFLLISTVKFTTLVSLQ